jgi:2-keto-3-deoxy-6-phosphogluconate aldolase
MTSVVVTALELGADLVKPFPASGSGPRAGADGTGGCLSAGTPEQVGERVQSLLCALREAR